MPEKEKTAEKDELVFPGAFLTTGEEFAPGFNTFEDEKGNILASCVGKAEFDPATREVSVSCIKETKVLDEGAVVTGMVTSVKENVALVEIFEAKKNNDDLKIPNPFAVLLISAVSEAFVKNLRDMFRIGDIIRAKVAKVNTYGTDLTTKGREFGTLKAFCIKCRHPLRLFGTQLKCTNCGNTETRKVSSGYLLR
jgi:exosome complex component CSL4